jgi:hypothetical protein
VVYYDIFPAPLKVLKSTLKVLLTRNKLFDGVITCELDYLVYYCSYYLGFYSCKNIKYTKGLQLFSIISQNAITQYSL